MKKKFIKIVLSLLLFVSVFYACSENNDEKETIKLKSDMTPSPAIDNATIGYMDNGTYVPINKALLVGFWKYKHNLPENTNFTNIHIIGGTSENGEAIHVVTSRSESGTISIASVLTPFGEPGSAMYLMQGSTCTCQSTNCEFNGCAAEVTNGCVCSPCGGNGNGDCKKTSTVVTNFARVFAYLKSIGVDVKK